jgi:L-threonylcarbamoyladenylate synthase
LIVHIASIAQLDELVLPYSETAAELMARFWPGPLTLVLPVRPGAVSPRVTAGLDTVAVRIPAHDTALRLIAAAGCPVAAPSANRSGRPSPTRAEHVREDLAGLIDGLVDGGPTGVGLESTVVELAGDTVRILRPGGVTPAQLRGIAAHVIVDDSGDGLHLREPEADKPASGEGLAQLPAAPRSPGMKYTHYAPRGEMVLVQGDSAAVRAYIRASSESARVQGERTGILTYEEHKEGYAADLIIACGSLSRLEDAAQGLYGALREFDAEKVERIWAEACPTDGIGLALMNRLLKASGNRLIRV